MVIKQSCKGNNNVQVAASFLNVDAEVLSSELPLVNNIKIKLDPTATKGSCVVGNTVYMNGTKLPALPKNKRANSVYCVNDKLWVNGYYWTGTKWKRMSKFRFSLMRK